jgi:microcystin degradation protein MlrC
MMTTKIFALSLFCSFLMLQSCQNTSNTKKYKVAVFRFQHETCTFCPGGDTKIEDWTRIREPIRGDTLLQKGGSYIKGFVKQAKAFNDIKLVGLTSPYSVFGGSSRSWNTEKSFNHFMSLMEADLKAQMPVQGVYLALHGAMATRNIPRPEAEIAKRIRAIVGDKIPIVGTFDLHGNEDSVFLKYADGAFVTKRYPHYDAHLQGERAARYLRQIMRGEYQPTTASRKPPIITGTVLQWTGQSPSMDIMERARRWENRKRDVFVNVFYGYPWSDVPDVGTTVHIMTNNNQALADEIADDMEAFIWRVREKFANGGYPMPKEAVASAKKAIAEKMTPVAMGEYSDRPGDATWILHELINQKVNKFLFACLRDERALEKLTSMNAKVGEAFDMEVGGFTGEQAGKPIRIQGEIKYFGSQWSYEKVAVIEFGKGNVLIITPAYEQITTLGRLDFAGINVYDYDVFVVKSRVHFRRGFDETGFAKTILVVDAPGDWFGTIRLDALDYKYAPINDLYPFDKN